MTDLELSDISKWRYQKKRNNYGSDIMIIIHLVLKMIPPTDPHDEELKKFLVLSKECKQKLERQIYKQALLYETDHVKLNKKRNNIWIQIMKMKEDNKDYYGLRDKVNSGQQEFEDEQEHSVLVTRNLN